MSSEYWTTRYNAARLPPAPLVLKAPLRRVWKYKPKGAGPGLIRVGTGAVFTTAGKSYPARLDLQTGNTAWVRQVQSSVIARWKEYLLVDACEPDRLFALDPETGEERWMQPIAAGMQDSFIVEDVLVGYIPGHFHAIDLLSHRVLWSVAERPSNPLVSNGDVVIRADDDVVAYDLKTGTMRWRRAGSDFSAKKDLAPPLGKAYQMGFAWRDLFVVRIGEPLLLTAFDIATGKTAWQADFPVQGYQAYGERAYGVEATGVYWAVDLSTSRTAFKIKLGEVPEAGGPKKGLMVSRPSGSWPWRGTAIAVSETHAFVSKPSGQIVVLGRETGEIEQVVEIDGMPAGGEPIIYENRLLVTDFNAAVYCFEGAA